MLTSPARRRGRRSGLEGRAPPGAQSRVGESAVLPTELQPHRTPGHMQGGACLMLKTLIEFLFFVCLYTSGYVQSEHFDLSFLCLDANL